MINSTYLTLGSKDSFNKALRHFFKVNEVVEMIEEKYNFADVVNSELDQEDIVPGQVLPMIASIVRDKYGYSYDSFDLPLVVNEFNKIIDETAKWTAIDIVMVYYNPNGQVYLINPKNSDHWDRVRELSINHLVVMYAKYLKGDGDSKIELEAITAIEEMLCGKDVYINKEFIDPSISQKSVKPKAAQQKDVPAGKRRATPKYSVQVTNELFHNGNVESWKKIIESYKSKYPGLDVVVFYEGELINDINALFKWGKVKHHSMIMFQVVGEDIKGVSKLQKYLFEGASPRFEQFLKGQVGQVLNLF